MDNLDIYVVEGPAGSGKSTAIQQQISNWKLKEPYPLVLDTSYRAGERNYKGMVGLTDISVRDMQRVAYALTSRRQAVVLDRWVLSSFVYDALRDEADLPIQENFHHTMLGWMSVLVGFQNVLKARGRINLARIQIHWMFNMPSGEVIIERRKLTKKEYPFTVFDELDGYYKVRELLNQWLDDYGLMVMVQHDVQDISYGDWAWNNLSL